MSLTIIDNLSVIKVIVTVADLSDSSYIVISPVTGSIVAILGLTPDKE
jgi:hypothetical protein